MDADHDFNRAEAIGKRVLVGITVLSHDDDEVVERHSFAGLVKSVEPSRGIELLLDDDTSYWLPPDTDSLREAPPGEYYLRETGQTVVNPDYLATWTITQATADSPRPPADGFTAPS